MIKQHTLTDKIFDIVMLSSEPVTVSDIKRALPDAVESSEISARLCKLAKRKFIFVAITARKAITGRKSIKCYSASPLLFNDNNYHQGNIFQDLLQTQ